MLALLAVIGLGVLGILFLHARENISSHDRQGATTWNIFSQDSAKNVSATLIEDISPEKVGHGAVTGYINTT